MRKVILGTLMTVILVGGLLLVERSIRLNRQIPMVADGTEGKNLPTDLKIRTFPGKEEVTLAKYSGKVVLINFWASWCEACMAEMPSIQRLYDTLKGEGFEVIGINVDENPATVVPKIIDRLKLNFPIYTEIGSNLSRQFNVVAIPFNVVADRKQKIVWSESGERDWASAAVMTEIRKLLKPI